MPVDETATNSFEYVTLLIDNGEGGEEFYARRVTLLKDSRYLRVEISNPPVVRFINLDYVMNWQVKSA